MKTVHEPDSDHYSFYKEWDYEIRVCGPGVVVRGWDYEAPKTDEYVLETRVDPREVEGETMAERRWQMIALGLARLNTLRKEVSDE